jgi:hypothetical protein
MADRFFDTSAAVKHYHSETGTAKVDALPAEAGAQHFLSDLAGVEFHSVMARLVRTGAITVGTFYRSQGKFVEQTPGRLRKVAVLHLQPPRGRFGLTQDVASLVIHGSVSLAKTSSTSQRQAFTAFIVRTRARDNLGMQRAW